MIFLKRQQPFLLHAAELCGKGAAVYGQKIGQLLPIKRDGKIGAGSIMGLFG